MAIMGQGLVLMAAGMGIVYLFLMVLIVVSKVGCRMVSKFDYLLPDETPRKAPAKAVADDDANVALAIAVALG